MTKGTEKLLVAGLILVNFVTGILAILLVGGGDDAFITYTFARNMAEGYGVTYYPGGPPIYGSTTLTWMLLLAFAGFVGFSIPITSTLLGMLFWSLSYVLVYAMFRDKLGRWPMLAVLLLEALSLRVEKLGQGMEAGLYTFLLLLCFFLYSREKVAASLLLSVGLIATRLDGGLVPLLIGTHYLLFGNGSRRFRLDSLWARFVSLLKAGWPSIVALLSLFALCWLYFGTMVPNTFLAKVLLYEDRRVFDPSLYLEFLSPWYTGNLSPASPLDEAPFSSAFAAAVIFFAGVGILRTITSWASVDALSLVWVPVYILAVWIFGLTPSPWYAAPTIPLIYVAFVFGITGDLGYLRSWETILRTPGTLAVFCAAAVVSLAMLFGGTVNGYNQITKDPLGDETPLKGRHVKLAQAVDREMKERGEESADIVAFEVGRLGFETTGRVHDILGLVSPEVVKHGKEDPMWLVRRYEPEYIMITDARKSPLSGPIIRSGILQRQYESIYTYSSKSKYRVHHKVRGPELGQEASE